MMLLFMLLSALRVCPILGFMGPTTLSLFSSDPTIFIPLYSDHTIILLTIIKKTCEKISKQLKIVALNAI